MPTSETLKVLDDLYASLSSELGNAVWSFARIEWLVYTYIGKLSVDRIDELIGDVGFHARVEILKRLIQRKETSEDKKSAALKTLSDAQKLAGIRNIIAHNPWRVSIDFQSKEFVTELRKYTNPDKKIDREQLNRFSKEANEVQQRLKEALDAL